jgi:hypothetical protein
MPELALLCSGMDLMAARVTVSDYNFSKIAKPISYIVRNDEKCLFSYRNLVFTTNG